METTLIYSVPFGCSFAAIATLEYGAACRIAWLAWKRATRPASSIPPFSPSIR